MLMSRDAGILRGSCGPDTLRGIGGSTGRGQGSAGEPARPMCPVLDVDPLPDQPRHQPGDRVRKPLLPRELVDPLARNPQASGDLRQTHELLRHAGNRSP